MYLSHIFLLSLEQYVFNVLLTDNSGKFEITEGPNLKCSGRIQMRNKQKTIPSLPNTTMENGKGKIKLDKTGLYQELRLRGYDYGPTFQSVQFYNIHGRYLTCFLLNYGYVVKTSHF